ncbi:ATP-binding protein [Clostridium swellfunianum]|uniref:ATP-binding protein n=1 Tax=Clostridium swellfunianum TaxID=1367462 RepID=UPI00202E7C77|nr:ATP-binding protein [Clostridium swellfunianum]MCM0648368.1 ATP-binding protein [Clostridium swellfunianum]
MRLKAHLWIINNLIDLTKIDSGNLQLNIRRCNIVESVEAFVQAVVDYASNKNISIIFDTDIEIEEYKLQLIFESLRQADNLLARRSEGSGIGLGLVKHLAERHNGIVNVLSK